MDRMKKLSVILLFNNDGTKLLLQKKDRTVYKGMLNGIGGKIEDSEMPVQGALREMAEEVSLHQEDMDRFEWIGTLMIPDLWDEKYPDMFPELWFFGGIVKNENSPHKPDFETEEIGWYDLAKAPLSIGDFIMPATDIKLAGEGDLFYFINKARKILFGQK